MESVESVGDEILSALSILSTLSKLWMSTFQDMRTL
jgi:hypothetical protein